MKPPNLFPRLASAWGRARLPAWSHPAALLLATLAGFGFNLARVGFFQDDWYLLWEYTRIGPQAFVNIFATQRVFLVGIYTLTVSLVGTHPLAWQVFALLARLLVLLAAWWSLKQLWPRQARPVAWVALLMAIYPAFLQHYAVVVYSQVYLILALFFLSFGWMLLAVRQPRRRLLLTAAALLVSLACLVTTEYFFGLELLRPLALWFLFSERLPDLRQRLRPVLIAWAPYLATSAGFAIYRLFFFHSTLYSPKVGSELLGSPSSTLLHLAQTVLQDWFAVTLFTWVKTLDFINASAQGWGEFLRPWLLIASAALVVALYLALLEKSAPQPERSALADQSWAGQAIALGLLGSLAAGAPYWVAGLSVDLSLPNDRFALAFMPGASLLVVGLVFRLVGSPRARIALVSLLVAFSLHAQVLNGLFFRQIHQQQANLFQQMVWRAPALQPGTLLLLNDLPYQATGNASMNAAYQWVYTPEENRAEPIGQLLYIPSKIGTPGLPDLTPGPDKANILVAYYEPPGCLLLLDPAIHNRLPRLPDDINQAQAVSHPERILPAGSGAAQIQARLFAQPPAPSWCEYFERADLARQQGDWQSVMALGSQAFQAGLAPAPKFEAEFLPFIEAYSRSGEWKNALQLTQRAIDSTPALQASLCQTWQRALAANPAPDAPRARVRALLSCEVP